jgi:quaternary ammonium compound-resistance protein SugE
MGWIYLIIGGALEVAFTTCMRYTEGFKNIPWTAAFLTCIAFGMYFLEMATRKIPMGTAYAIWTGIGAIGTVMVGTIWYSEPSSLLRILFILGIVICIAGLKLTSGH